MRRRISILFFVLSLISTIILGCSSTIEKSNNKNVTASNESDYRAHTIKVQQRIGVENKYESLTEITELEKVRNIQILIEKIEWENAKVNMDRPPDYKFVLLYKSTTSPQYSIWITPSNEHIELVREGNKYVKLDKDTSAQLFELITGSALSD